MNRPQKLGGGGENCTPDYLLCEQMPCCLGYAAFENEYDAVCESALAENSRPKMMITALAQERSVATLLLRALPAHCGINAAKAHTQCQGIFDRVCDGGFFHPIQCGVNWIFQITRWMQFTSLHLQ